MPAAGPVEDKPFGGGWNQDEMENHGTIDATRFKRMRESIEAIKDIWTKEATEYHGEFVDFETRFRGAQSAA